MALYLDGIRNQADFSLCGELGDKPTNDDQYVGQPIHEYLLEDEPLAVGPGEYNPFTDKQPKIEQPEIHPEPEEPSSPHPIMMVKIEGVTVKDIDVYQTMMDNGDVFVPRDSQLGKFLKAARDVIARAQDSPVLPNYGYNQYYPFRIQSTRTQIGSAFEGKLGRVRLDLVNLPVFEQLAKEPLKIDIGDRSIWQFDSCFGWLLVVRGRILIQLGGKEGNRLLVNSILRAVRGEYIHQCAIEANLEAEKIRQLEIRSLEMELEKTRLKESMELEAENKRQAEIRHIQQVKELVLLPARVKKLLGRLEPTWAEWLCGSRKPEETTTLPPVVQPGTAVKDLPIAEWNDHFQYEMIYDPTGPQQRKSQ